MGILVLVEIFAFEVSVDTVSPPNERSFSVAEES